MIGASSTHSLTRRSIQTNTESYDTALARSANHGLQRPAQGCTRRRPPLRTRSTPQHIEDVSTPRTPDGPEGILQGMCAQRSGWAFVHRMSGPGLIRVAPAPTGRPPARTAHSCGDTLPAVLDESSAGARRRKPHEPDLRPTAPRAGRRPPAESTPVEAGDWAPRCPRPASRPPRSAQLPSAHRPAPAEAPPSSTPTPRTPGPWPQRAHRSWPLTPFPSPPPVATICSLTVTRIEHGEKRVRQICGQKPFCG